MKKPVLLIILSISIVFISCNKEKKDTNHDAITLSNKSVPTIDSNSIAKDQNQLEKVVGGGFEPAWDISITKKKGKEYEFKINALDEEMKTSGQLLLKSEFNRTTKFEKVSFEGKDNTGKTISILYEKEHCLNMAGDDSGGAININWKGIVLKGCGSHALEKKHKS
ncbi:hypothetical protein [Aquimarina sp. RZ0]|uniref:hypothetical protein n=1 Tax=Aquimarina sp. RZ0 TaxID=2607730 RepID=UPI0011F15A58|nr:hypothetical protein [Aquimarina sp. RZ0]KAA1243260.1 hypothetical protein F0000_21895 [Aquimarina sp. RZ0]